VAAFPFFILTINSSQLTIFTYSESSVYYFDGNILLFWINFGCLCFHLFWESHCFRF